MCPQLFNIIGEPNRTPPRVNLYELLEDAKEIHYNWLEVVEMYSDRILTYPQDVLPAISGAAKLFADKLSDDYLAGIWRSDLRGLVWKYQNLSVTPSQDLRKVLTRLNSPKDYIAPSWSWAGHRGIAFNVPRKGQDISLFLDWEAKGGTLRGIFKLVPIATYQSTYNGDITTTTTGLVTHKSQKEGNFHHRVGRFDLDSPAEGSVAIGFKAITDSPAPRADLFIQWKLRFVRFHMKKLVSFQVLDTANGCEDVGTERTN
ncbi:hypothetical protein E0Z10_g2414 [Xylaria hypoxylon]|uniref:Uncharacterized protein n=1 Tax=Xylaria hypoxylon TaxID=37992 RepID=A0A4Z0ZC89_9PEZI|nr:hypothetical protein E0Z10_g2414 [Xylaria hypoxylon]